jgi:putative oxidoreductase
MNNSRLLIPALGRFYTAMGGPSEAILRIIAGVALMTHGYSKILNPMGAVGLVESLGFYPGVIFSPLLAITEFFGGLLIAIGLFTRPAALAAMFVLLVTVWFHWITQSEGYFGAEKSILWAAICFYFVVHGGRYLAVDKRLRREI